MEEMIDHKAKGRKNKRKGNEFELKVRKSMEKDGWIVNKHQNNIDLEENRFIKAKQQFIGIRGMGLGSGFPDFLMFQKSNSEKSPPRYRIIFVECKTNGILSKIEKLKMNWLLKNDYTCWVAYEDEKQIKWRKFVEYKEPNRTCREKTGD